MSFIKQTFKTLTLVLLLLIAAKAQEVPGRIQIDTLNRLETQANKVVEVTLDGKILQLAIKALDALDNPELKPAKEILGGMKGIYVRVYEFEQPNAYTSADVDVIRNQLRSPVWQRIVGVRSKKDGENVEVFTLTADGDKFGGITIVAANIKSLAVINIVGLIDVEKAMSLLNKMDKIGVPKIELEKENEKK